MDQSHLYTIIQLARLYGIAEARRKGVRFGRRPLPRPEGYTECAALWREGRLSSRDAAGRLGVSYVTFLRWIHEDEEK